MITPSFAFLQQTTEQRRQLILHGSIPKTLAVLSVPSLMLGLMQSLQPLIDGLFINNTSDSLVFSAVTFCTPVLNMMMALAQGLSVASMALIGQQNGKGDLEQSKKTSLQSILFATTLGLLTAPLLIAIAWFVSRNLHPDISANVFKYLSLYAFVLPLAFLESVYNAIKNANGQPEAPFIRMILMIILKIIFNFLFLSVLRLGITGCILASFAANMIITVWMYLELFVKKSDDRLEIKNFHFDPIIIRQLFQVGIPAMLMSFLLNLGFHLINLEIQKYGPVVLNGQGIAGSITAVCFNLPSSFSSAVTTMVSMQIGYNNPQKAKKACLVGCIMSAITAAVLIAIIVPLSGHLTVLFTRDPEVLYIANRSLHIYTYSVIGFGVCMVIQGAFVGLGKTKVPLILSILRIWLLRYVFILLTEPRLEFYAVFWGNLFSNYMAAIIAIILITRTKWVSAIKN